MFASHVLGSFLKFPLSKFLPRIRLTTRSSFHVTKIRAIKRCFQNKICQNVKLTRYFQAPQNLQIVMFMMIQNATDFFLASVKGPNNEF